MKRALSNSVTPRKTRRQKLIFSVNKKALLQVRPCVKNENAMKFEKAFEATQFNLDHRKKVRKIFVKFPKSFSLDCGTSVKTWALIFIIGK